MEKLNCECGCGEFIYNNKRFIHGHNQKGKKNFGVINSKTGVLRTLETKAKISFAKKGKPSHMKGKCNIGVSLHNKERWKKYRENKNLVVGKCGCGCGKEVVGKIFIHGHNNRKKLSIIYCGCGCGKTVKTKGKLFVVGHNPSNISSKRNEKISITMKEKIKLGTFIPVRPLHIKSPNKTEIFTDKLIQTARPNDFIFSGDGKVWIEGKNPDWFNVNGKKQVIELFGDYHHGEKFTGRTKNQEEEFRKSHFKRYGYDCLVLWASEVRKRNNFENVIEKIKNF